MNKEICSAVGLSTESAKTSTWNSSVGIDSLTIYQKILIASFLLELSPNKDSYSVREILDSKVSPTEYLTQKMLSICLNEKLASVCQSSGTPRIIFAIKNTDDTLRNLIKQIELYKYQNDDICRDSENLVFDALAAECIQHAVNILKSNGIDSHYNRPPPKVLIELLGIRSVSDVYMLIWRAAASFDKRDIRLMSLSGNLADVVEGVFEKANEYHAHYIRSNRPIKPFNRDYSYAPSALVLLLTENFLGNKNYFYTAHPTSIR